MGNCCGSSTTVPSPPPPPLTERTAPAPVLSRAQPNTEKPPVPSSQALSRRRSRTASTASKPEWTHCNGMPSQDSNLRSRTKSEPQSPPQSLKSSSSQNLRVRAETLTAPKGRNRLDARPPMPEHPKSGARAPTMSYPSRRSLTSTVKQVLTDHQQFRILVVGKRGSGKSSLINAAFRVDMSAVQKRAPNINFAFCPDDNHRVVVHECSGLEPGDIQGSRVILDFISNRTDPSRPASERLHAIWICVPTFDAINGSIGEGVEEILSMRRVPVVVAFTKSDLAFPRILESESENSEYQDRARSKAYAQCERLCRPLFRKEPRDVPAELVSVAPQFGALLNNLIVTTDQFIMGSRTASALSAQSSSQGTESRISPVPLVWSVALRASRDITIQTSIEIGRSRYWHNLWSSLVFTDQPLKSCVNIIHVDIVEIWNLCDRNRYLTSNQFKINMSHVVKDLAVPAGDASPRNGSRDKFADWVYDVYRERQENVQCVMGYIVNLTVIMDGISRTAAGNVTENAALKVMSAHVRSGRRDSIHRDIRSFVAFVIRSPVRPAPQKDLVLERIIDLIRKYCSYSSEKI